MDEVDEIASRTDVHTTHTTHTTHTAVEVNGGGNVVEWGGRGEEGEKRERENEKDRDVCECRETTERACFRPHSYLINS